MRSDHRRRLGLIVNPIAGMGGSVGLKGTDGPAILAAARRRGAVPLAQQRTERALAKLLRLDDRLDLVVAAGAMGQDAALAAGLSPSVIAVGAGATTGPEHTRAAAAMMAGQGCALILFAGGDLEPPAMSTRLAAAFLCSAFQPGSRCTRQSSP